MTDVITTPPRHQIARVRHETARRSLRVTEVSDLTPHMRRIVLGGPELAGFESPSYDDHVKLFIPLGSTGLETAARNITPRRYDAQAQTLEIHIAVHEGGPVSEWATGVRTGSKAAIGGPRGSFVVPADFDWYVLAGDETALPAIGRRLEELPAGARAFVIAEVTGADEELYFTSKATVETTWLYRGTAPAGTTTQLEDALERLTFPAGEGYVWVATESDIAKRIRPRLIERGIPKDWLRVAAYWKRNASDVHETITD